LETCENMSVQVPYIKAIFVLDSEGDRIAVNYSSKAKGLQELKDQLEFEKKLHQKTCRTNARVDAEILMFQNCIAVYKFCSDAFFYVLADSNENELVVLSVLNALEETMSNLLRNQVSKKLLVENLDLLLLAIDEITDDGIIMEIDSTVLTNRVAMKGADKPAQDMPIAEQTFSQALAIAKEQLVKSFNR